MSLTFRFIRPSKKLYEVLDAEASKLRERFHCLDISQNKSSFLIEYNFDFKAYDDDPSVIDQNVDDLFEYIAKISKDHHASVAYRLHRGEYDDIQSSGVIVDGDDIEGNPSEILEQKKSLARFEKSIFGDLLLKAGRGIEFASALAEYISEKKVSDIIARLKKHNSCESLEFFDGWKNSTQSGTLDCWSTVSINIYGSFKLDASIHFDDLAEREKSLLLFKTSIDDRTAKAFLSHGYVIKTEIYAPINDNFFQVFYLVFPDYANLDLSWTVDMYSELIKQIMFNKDSYCKDEIEIIDGKIEKLSLEKPDPWRYLYARYKELVKKDLSLAEQLAEEGNLACQKLCAYMHYRNQFSTYCKDNWFERSKYFMRMAMKQGDGWANKEIKNLLADKDVNPPPLAGSDGFTLFSLF